MNNSTDTQISQLIINQLTKTQYETALNQNKINDEELYFITDDTTEASSVSYDNRESRLESNDVQGALDEIARTSCKPSRMVELVLRADSWVDRTQALSVPGLLKDQNGIIGLGRNLSEEAYDEAYLARLRVTSQEDNELTIIYDGKIPECDISVWLIILG